MATERGFFPPRSRVLVGVLLLPVVAGLTFLRMRSAAGPLETLAFFEQQRDAGQVNAAGLASAQYHAAHALTEQADRWHLSGYATQGLLGALVGLGLIVSGRRAGTA